MQVAAAGPFLSCLKKTYFHNAIHKAWMGRDFLSVLSGVSANQSARLAILQS